MPVGIGSRSHPWGDGVAMQRKRLDSWKAIAEFMGRSLRTVQRWHDLNGLPVHHFGGNKGSVFAFEEEIDAWLAGLAEGTAGERLKTDDKHECARRTSRELTMTANAMWETRSVKNIQTVSDLYHKAVENDPSNASAFIGLANAMVFSAMNDVVDAVIAFPMAQDALRRIPSLESDSIEAKCPAAWIDLLYHRNWRQARSRFEEVVRLRPASSFARSGLALSRLADGNIEEAVECAWEAWRLNPLVRTLSGLLCWFVYLSGDYERVLHLAEQMRCANGDSPGTGMVEALVLAQDPICAASLARLEEATQEQPQNQLLHGLLGYAYGQVGQETKARKKQTQLVTWAENGRRSKGYALALAYLGLGEEQEAISWLETAFAEGSLWSFGFRSDPMLRSLRGNPRFERLVGKIGAPHPYRAPDIRTSVTGILISRAAVGERS
jgi:tetratricopeptide (TPR) repeat protein